jgi:hypothetical protein
MEVSHIFGLLSYAVKVLTKNVFGYNLGDFLQAHLVTLYCDIHIFFKSVNSQVKKSKMEIRAKTA